MSTERSLSPASIDALAQLSDTLLQAREVLLQRLLDNLTEQLAASRERRPPSNPFAAHGEMREFLELDELILRVDVITDRIPGSPELESQSLSNVADALIHYQANYPALRNWSAIVSVLEHGPVHDELALLASPPETSHVRQVLEEKKIKSGWLKGLGKRRED
jgi:hypothetical protein